MNALISYRTSNYHPALDRLQEAITSRSLRHRASHIAIRASMSPSELESAIHTAICICAEENIPIDQHFREFYLTDRLGGTVVRDWMLSDLARLLVMLNGSNDNPQVRVTRLRAAMAVL